jgi:hypothetical protein
MANAVFNLNCHRDALVQDDNSGVHDLKTADITLISHTLGRSRRAECSIQKIMLQAAVKFGHKSANRHKRWQYKYEGFVYITDDTSRHEITCWRTDDRLMLRTDKLQEQTSAIRHTSRTESNTIIDYLVCARPYRQTTYKRQRGVKNM